MIRRILGFFIESPLTPLLVGASLLLGTIAVLLLPREEEPQITVPMIDVFVQMPGASAKEVEERVTKPLEKLVWELPGVESVVVGVREGQLVYLRDIADVLDGPEEPVDYVLFSEGKGAQVRVPDASAG